MRRILLHLTHIPANEKNHTRANGYFKRRTQKKNSRRLLFHTCVEVTTAITAVTGPLIIVHHVVSRRAGVIQMMFFKRPIETGLRRRHFSASRTQEKRFTPPDRTNSERYTTL